MLNSNFEDPIKNLYLIYSKKNNQKKLLEFAKKLYEINNESDLYSYQFAYAHELNNNNKLALEFYIKCIDRNGANKIKALNNVGSIYLKNNRPKTSLRFFLEAYNYNKNDKIIINNLLLNYINLKDIKRSNQFFKIAESFDDKYIEFLYNKAEYKILELFLKYSTAINVIITIEKPTITPNIRLPYSIHASTILKAVGSIWKGIWSIFVGGIHLPKHLGQSGHPKPEPDTRTSPPTKINR